VAHDERRLEVLRAIVQDYVSTNDPVGSKALAERHDLGVSPATIRNDMAVLEEQGYITQPHTSAGRVPTDKGYRLFVDRLSAVKPLSVAEKRAIERFLDTAPQHLRGLVATVSATLLETLVEPSEDRLVIGGTANLARGNALDFPGTVRPLLEALEEQVVVLRLMSQVDASTVLVRIGEENAHEALTGASFVSVGYGAPDRPLGGLGIVGPTRMDYPGNMAAVRAVARYVGHLLAES
jgi:transcriptional regulator of heat shock response